MPKGDPFDTTGYGVGDSAPGAGTLSPVSTNPVARSVDIKGASMQVATIADRDAIPGDGLARDDPAQHRQEGMTCWVQANATTYRLVGGVDNVNWVADSSGGAPTFPGANNTGALLAQGTLVAVDDTAALRVQPFDISSGSMAAARFLGVVSQAGGIANGASGEVTIVGFLLVRFKAGLTLNNGDEIYGSDNAGLATNLLDLNANPPPSGGLRQRIGAVLDQSTYAGAQTALCVVYPGQRREE